MSSTSYLDELTALETGEAKDPPDPIWHPRNPGSHHIYFTDLLLFIQFVMHYPRCLELSSAIFSRLHIIEGLAKQNRCDEARSESHVDWPYRLHIEARSSQDECHRSELDGNLNADPRSMMHQ